MQEGRPSFTSMVVATVRAIYSELPEPIRIAQDPVAANILPLPLALSARLAGLAPKQAAKRIHRAVGTLTAGMSYNVELRTRAIDDALREALTLACQQLIVLGAGLDARAYRMHELQSTSVFEVDHPSTQADKRRRLEKSREIPLAKNLAMVAVDFEKDDLAESLEKAGYSSEVPSFWIWEGVTMYLSRSAVQGTLQTIAKSAAPKSRIAMTYAEPRPNDLERKLVNIGGAVAHWIGEPIVGLISSSELAQLAQAAGFSVVSDEAATDWSARYWAGEPTGPFEWERLLVVEKPAA